MSWAELFRTSIGFDKKRNPTAKQSGFKKQTMGNQMWQS